MKRFAWIASITTGLFAQQASFEGTMTVDGKTMPIRYVCVYEEQFSFEEDKFFHSFVILPEAPPAGSSKSCKAIEAAFEKRAKTTGLPALYPRMIGPKWNWVDTAFFSSGEHTSIYKDYPKITNYVPAPGTAPGVIAGRMFTKGVAEAGGWPSFSLDLKFNVPLEKPVRLKGAEAQKHPAAVGVKRYLDAMSKGDLNGMQELLTAAGRKAFQEEAKATDLKTMLPMMKGQAQYVLTYPNTAVTVEDGVAYVVLSRMEGKTKLKFETRWREENGAWRQIYGLGAL